MTYIEITFTGLSRELSDVLIAMLSDMHYEGFEEDANTLKAFISQILFDKKQLENLVEQFQLQYTISELPDVNWNEVWESNFQPVIVGNWALRAEFHQPIKTVQHEIIITPKMSFGTGHHATTFMMIQHMQQIDFAGKRVLDFGTGTGVLAILACKLGAAEVIAIDNDSHSIENAMENFENNDVDDIELLLADTASTEGVFDIILANITRNVIQENFSLFNKHLIKDGMLLLSGLLTEDENAILTLAAKYNFVLHKNLQRENWISLLLIKP